MPIRPVFIDLFSGCGGLSMGLLAAGWKGAFAIERSSDAFLTYRHNLIDSGRFDYQWPDWLPMKGHDIDSVLETYSAEISALAGSIDLIAGGPPCQGFSPAGKRNPNDPRNRMAERYIEMVRLVKPKFLIIENVKGFDAPFKANSRRKKPITYSQLVKNRLQREGYKVEFKVLKCAEWGVPQLRPRFILLATRKDVLPKWTAFKSLEDMREAFLTARGLDTARHQTAIEAIGDLVIAGKSFVASTDGSVDGFLQIDYQDPEVSSDYIKLMRKGMEKNSAPNSLRLSKHREKIKARFEIILRECEKGRALNTEQRERFGMKKHSLTPLCPNKPAPTMTTLPDDFLHFSEPRILTVREMARIQSFPDWFEFLGKYTTGGKERKNTCPRYTQVGNAVPPLVSEALGELLLSAVESSLALQQKVA